MMFTRKNVMTVTGLALFAGVMTFLPADALAQAENPGGSGLLNAGAGLMESNYGLFVGLIVAALGLWRWLMSQDSWGVMLIIGGIIITAFPGIFEGLYKGTSAFFQAAGSQTSSYGTDIRGTKENNTNNVGP